jgi:ribosomal-protein-alanine N-acetyltransferase
MEKFFIQDLTTPRLQLRKLQMDDLPQYYHIASSQAVTKYMLWNPHTSMEESIASIQKVLEGYENGTCCRWGIVLNGSNTLIGIIDLLPWDSENGIFSFAYMLCEDFWNQGYGTEALTAVIHFAFLQCGAAQIQADHFAANPASGAVMKKTGMEYQESLPQKYEKNGILHDAHLYRITREQWLCIQQNVSFCDNS